MIELLEKRVKSRFSHLLIHFTHPRDLKDFISPLKDILMLRPADSKELKITKGFVDAFNIHVEDFLEDPKVMEYAEYLFESHHDLTPLLNIFVSSLSKS